MNVYLKRTLSVIMFLMVFCLVSCFDDKYDLEKDIDMSITVGGQTLVVPLGETEAITLDKIIDESETFKLGADSIYAFKKKDNINDVHIDVDAVNINIDKPQINPFVVDFEESTHIAPFKVDVNPANFNVTSPKIEVEENKLPEVELSFRSSLISVPGISVNQTLTLTNSKEITVSMNNTDSFEDVEKVEAVYFGTPDAQGICQGQLVTFNIDLTAINSMLESGSKQMIEELTVNFPQGFVLAAPYDYGGTLQVQGNVLTVKNARIQNKESLEYQFYVQKYENIFTPSQFEHKGTLDFTLKYNIEGKFKAGAAPNGDLVAGLEKTTFHFWKAAVVTKDVDVTVDNGEFNFNTDIDGLSDLKSIKAINLAENTYLDLTLNQLVLPFQFHETSVFIIDIPKIIRLEPISLTNGILFDNEKNQLIIPANSLLQKGNHVKLAVKDVDFTVDNNPEGRLVDAQGHIILNETMRYYAQSAIDGHPSQGTLVVKGGNTLYTDEISELTRNLSIISKCATSNTDMVEVENALVVANAVSADVNTSTDFNVHEDDIPEEVKSLKKVGLENGKPIKIKIAVDFKDIPKDIKHGIKMDPLRIDLPKFFLFVNNKDIDENNVMTLWEHFTPSLANNYTYTKEIEIAGLDFTKLEDYATEGIQIKDDHILEIPTKYTHITVDGTVRTADGEEVNSKNFEKFNVYPSIEVQDMTIGTVVGKVDPKIDPVDETVDLDLDSDLDFLKNDSSELHLKNPIINVKLTSDVGVPVNLDLMISGHKYGNDTPIEGSVVTANTTEHPDFKLYPAIDREHPVTTHILISKNKISTMPVDTESDKNVNLVIPDLANLLVHLPDEVKFKLNATVDQNVDHVIDITPNYNNGNQARFNIIGDYDVNVPLVFEEMNILYKDSVDNLQEDLWDFLDIALAAELDVTAELINRLPADLKMTATATDLYGNELKTIKIKVFINDEEDGIIPGVPVEGQMVKVPIRIELKAKDEDELKRLDKLQFNVGATINHTINGLPLKGNQSIQFVDVKAHVKKVNLDLN